MKLAAVIMILGGLVAFTFSIFKIDYFQMICSGFWLISGLFAIISLCQIQPNFLFVTIVIVLLSLASTIVALAILIYERSTNAQILEKQYKEVGADISLEVILVGYLLCSALDIWFLFVSVKCLGFLRAKKASLITDFL